jgi:hypothetical protein
MARLGYVDSGGAHPDNHADTQHGLRILLRPNKEHAINAFSQDAIRAHPGSKLADALAHILGRDIREAAPMLSPAGTGVGSGRT